MQCCVSIPCIMRKEQAKKALEKIKNSIKSTEETKILYIFVYFTF